MPGLTPTPTLTEDDVEPIIQVLDHIIVLLDSSTYCANPKPTG